MKSDKNKLVDKVMEDISKSSILPETKTALLTCTALNIMLIDLDRQIRRKYVANGIKAKPIYDADNILTGMANYSKAVSTALYWYDRDTGRRIEDATLGSYGVKAYDWFSSSANDIAQIILLVVDRCTNTDDAVLGKVKEFIKGMKSGGFFSDEDIERFKLK